MEEKKKYLALVNLDSLKDLQKELAESVDVNDLTDDKLVHGGDPYERNSHITLLFGMPRLPSKDCCSTLENSEKISLKALEVKAFERRNIVFKEGGSHSYDVLYVELEVPENLLEMRKMLIADTDAKPDLEFKPHMTIGFLKPGKAQKYSKVLKSETAILEEIVFREWQKADDLLVLRLEPKEKSVKKQKV